MFKPALVIGLGGTGVLSLRHLKASMLAASQTRDLPKHVKLIAIDTVNDKVTSPSGESKLASLQVQLEPGEYYWVGGNIWDYSRQVEAGDHPQVSSWFQASTYRRVLQKAAFDLQRGAGQLRQFGRVAIFKDVGSPGESKIVSLLKNALRDIRTEVPNLGNLDIYIIASVAGGTGAGMFVDLAWIARQYAKQEHSLNTTVRGFLVLPESFGAIPGGVKESMRARAAAAMRENKRFMVDFEPEIGYPLYYHRSGNDPVWRGKIDHKLFDFLYHIDGHREVNPLDKFLPDVGVTPTIADAISAFIDKASDVSEDRYAQHTTNVMTAAGIASSARGRTAFDSAIGTYTLVLPIHHMIESLTYKLALEALEAMLVPVEKDSNGYPTLLAMDQNPEAPNVRGRTAALRLLQAADVQSWTGQEKASGTPLLKEILRVATAYSSTNNSLIAELATRNVTGWEPSLDPGGTTPQIQAMRTRVSNEIHSQLMNDVPVSKGGEKPQDGLTRIQSGVDLYKSFHLGNEDRNTGQRIGGKFQEGLSEYSFHHLERFRVMLRIECLNILNGGMHPDHPASTIRKGKLGYLIDYLSGLEAAFGLFIKALNEAHAEREKRQILKGAEGAANGARLALMQRASGFGWTGRQRSYLEAEQRQIDVVRAIMMADAARNCAQAMLDHARALREDAESWARVLGLGYDSLYGRLQRSRGQLAELVRADADVKVREILWDETYMNGLYTKYAVQIKNGLNELLSSWSWRYEERQMGDREEYHFQFVAGDERLGQTMQERNLDLILVPSRKIFAGAWNQESILGYLMNRYRLAEDLGQLLLDHNAPLLEKRDGQGSPVPANYLHMAYGDSPEEGDYLDRLRRRLEQNGAAAELNAIINSADRFKARYVTTLDLIPLERIESYQRGLPVYRVYTEEVTGLDSAGRLGREALHVFPAEVNATQYESRLGQLAQPIREFHNDVVMQLEDLTRLRLFIRSWAYGVIRETIYETGGGREQYYLLELPPEKKDIFADKDPLCIFLTRPSTQQPSLLEALKRFNYIGKDARLEMNIKIDYDRVIEAQKSARETKINAQLANVQLPSEISARVAELSESERTSVLRYWVDREYLVKMRDEQKSRAAYTAGQAVSRDNDLAVVFYLTLADEVTALENEIRRLTR